MSAFDYLSLGYFLPWVSHTVSSEISVHLKLFNDTSAKFLLNGHMEGSREAKRCRGGTCTVGSLSVQLDCFGIESLHYLTQLLQSSEGIHISELKLVDGQLKHQDVLCLANLVESSKSLTVLKLIHTSLAKESRLAFRKMLQEKTTLKTLDIYRTFQVTEFITDIAEGLKYNTTLQNLQFYDTLTVQELELLANTLTINTTLENLRYFQPTTELSALAKRLWASGVLHQLLSIAIERTVEWFGEEETMKAFEAILLAWNSSTQMNTF